jgi:hypothetical protein
LKSYDGGPYGPMPQPETFEELVALTLENRVGDHFNVHMWRGQADAAWLLHSGAYRRLKRTRKPVTERDVCYYDQQLLKEATHRGYRHLEGRELSDFDLLARLQHMGAATRLVDATRNALVGLYFAAESMPDRTGALFGFHGNFLGGVGVNNRLDPYLKQVENLERFGPQTWEPPAVTPRIAAQHSQYLFSFTEITPKGSLRLKGKDGSFLAIAISLEFKQKALTVLSEVFDIRYPTLFPDIHGFAYRNSTLFDEFADDRI